MMRKPRTKITLYQNQLADACRGLIYVSETDSTVEPFFASGAEAISKRTILDLLNRSKNTPITETSFDTFFKRLTAKREWHTKTEAKRAEAFQKLRELLELELTELNVFKVGSVQIDILVVGKDTNGDLAGVTMKAVET